MAYDFSFDQYNLAREFRKIDFTLPQVADEQQRLSIVSRAVADAAAGLSFLALDTHVGSNATTYQISLITHELILRKLNRNLRYLTRVRQSDRETIIKSLRAILSEGHKYNVYRLDIEKFYESINLRKLHHDLARDSNLARSTLKVLSGFVSEVSRRSIPGVPRGLAISSTLSELYLRNFDKRIKALPEVYFYARYVDDIVIVTTGEESQKDFLRCINRSLPQGLRLHRGKTAVFNFSGNEVKSANLSATIEFLGYSFHVYEIPKGPKLSRKVTLDISTKKVNRFKTRVCKSFIRFQSECDFDLLQTRMNVLTGNYNLYDREKGLTRNLGIYFNYRFIDHSESSSLASMDGFLKYCLFSPSAPTAAAAGMLSTSQKKALLSKMPSQAHLKKTFYHVSTEGLVRAVGCWKHD